MNFMSGPDGTHDRGRRQLTGTEPVADLAAARGRHMERGRGRGIRTKS
jgi:hypothetical protein